MTFAALILVGVVLVGGTLLASLLVQRRAERIRTGPSTADGIEDAPGSDEMGERLRRGLRSRLSHELRTPLNSIITLSQLLIEDDKATLSPEQRRYLEVIRRNGRNLLALVDHIAEGSRSWPDAVAVAPGAPAEPAGPPNNASTASTQAATATPRGSASVLLIEDDAIERQRIGSFIEAAGYDVTRAASGEEGLGLLRSRPFGVVVLDLIMPEMTGLDVLRAARTEERLADVRFIVLSAMYMTKTERQVLGPKVADVVRKGETMPRALTLALRRAVKPPAYFEPHAHPGDGGRRL
jgi:CheY-like chemotaxis protein